jgi:hypothetical protein
MLLAEAAVFVGPMDQPLAGLLQNPGVNQLYLPLRRSSFYFVGARGLPIDLNVDLNILKNQ